MKNYFANPLFCLFAGIGFNRVAGFSPLYSALARTDYSRSIHLFSAKRPKEFSNSFEDDGMKLSKRSSIKSFQPKTENQKKFIDLMRNDTVDIIIAIGPAGTGKTMLACNCAMEALRLGKVNKVVVTRPVVSVDEELGFLPGGLESKMDPWTRPIFDTFRETYSAKELDKMTEEGVIEIVPLGFMRGRTFKNAWIIADEMQNSSPTQMFMLATRIGEGSKMIITGDLNQSDLNPKSNGLLEIYGKVRGFEIKSELDCVRHIELDREDVQRSRAAKTVLNIYDPIIVTDFKYEVTENSKSEIFERCDSPTKLPPSVSLNHSNSCEQSSPEFFSTLTALHPEFFTIPEQRMNVGIDHTGASDVNICSTNDKTCGEHLPNITKKPERNAPLDYTGYENDALLTNEFEYLDQVVTSEINVKESIGFTDFAYEVTENSKSEICRRCESGASDENNIPQISSPDCFKTPTDWVDVDNDAALIPIHHISKYYNK